MSNQINPEMLENARKIAKKLSSKMFTPEMIQSAKEACGDKTVLIGCNHEWSEEQLFQEQPNGDGGAWCKARCCRKCSTVLITEMCSGKW